MRGKLGSTASLFAGAVADLAGLAATSAALVHDTGVLGISADVLEGGSVTVVLVDADNLATVASSNTLDVDVALALGLALMVELVEKLGWFSCLRREGVLTLPQDR